MKRNYPIPANEKQRLKELHSYNILDTISEKEYDSISKIAAQICNVPVSLITFVDKNRQWFKSHAGLELRETIRDISFCNYTILDPENVLVVPDLREDERFANNPLVAGDLKAVFYAGAPLVTPEGNALGSICVLDSKVNNLDDGQKEALQSLATQVMARLELRKKITGLRLSQKKLKKANNNLKQFAHIVSHDMKTPLANISMITKSFNINYANQLDESGIQFLSIIDKSAIELLSFVDDILKRSKYEGDKYATKKIDSYTLIKRVIDMIAPPESIEIAITGTFPKLQIDKIALQQVFQNLITNAIKYNDKEKAIINISCNSDSNAHHFNIADNGCGIEQHDIEKIFDNRQTLKNTDRYGNKGTGFGLARVKDLIEKTGGKISVDSTKNSGSVFKVSIPYSAPNYN